MVCECNKLGVMKTKVNVDVKTTRYLFIRCDLTTRNIVNPKCLNSIFNAFNVANLNFTVEITGRPIQGGKIRGWELGATFSQKWLKKSGSRGFCRNREPLLSNKIKLPCIPMKVMGADRVTLVTPRPIILNQTGRH